MRENMRGASRLRRWVRVRTIATLLPIVAAVSPGGILSASSATDLSPLAGNVHRLAMARFDMGEAPTSLRLKGLDIVFAKTPGQERALQALLSAQQDPKSLQYHKWLAPTEYGERFGASEATLAAVTNWLKSNGLVVGQVPMGRGHLPFSGTKRQVEGALRTSIHLFDVHGDQHYANVADPLIPAAFTPVIAAIRGLNDFHPRTNVRPSRPAPRGVISLVGHGYGSSLPAPDTHYLGTASYPGYVGPTDFAIIYNLLPEYQQGITGAGVTVAIAAQSDLDPSVLTAFWTAFGVSGSSFGLAPQQFSSIPVPGGTDPGQTKDGNEDEAYLDTEILGGLAPGAQLILVRDQDANNAVQYAIDQNLAAVLNISFSQCEFEIGPTGNAAINSMFQQAVAQGITITVSTDDAGVAGCTASSDLGISNDVNTAGFAVNGLASTPYDLAVGGTDFDPTAEAPYWGSSNQPGTLATATSHIPEIVWNESCANPVFATYYGNGDPIAFCNTGKIGNQSNPFIDVAGSGGGVSSCTMTDAGGSCSGGYAIPSWQQHIPVGFMARAIPDVVMIATRWLMCSYDTTPCDPTQAPTLPPAATGTIKVLDGTSAAAPSVAAIVALLDQAEITQAAPDGRQGLVNTLLYQLGAGEISNPAIQGECNASMGAITSPYCVFFDVTNGSNVQPCSVAEYVAKAAGSLPASTCASESGDAIGIMQVDSPPLYGAFPGFDLSTGLGSINAAVLIETVRNNPAPGYLAASASGQTVTLTWGGDGSATLGFDVYEGIGGGRVAAVPVQQNVMGTSTTIIGLQPGQLYSFAIAGVSSTGISPQSSQVAVSIVPGPPAGLKVVSAGANALTLTWTASSGASSYNVFAGTTAGGESTTPAVTGVRGQSVTFTSLASGQKYFFTVEAADLGGDSAPSVEASGIVAPSAPNGVSASAGGGSVSLSWAPSTGASSYNVYMGTHSGGEGAQPQLSVATTSATVTGLTSGTTYYFTVEAVNAGGTSGPSSQVKATPTAPSGGGGALDWLALAGIAGVKLWRYCPFRYLWNMRRYLPGSFANRSKKSARHNIFLPTWSATDRASCKALANQAPPHRSSPNSTPPLPGGT
jgi:pro-kumamolisin-like protein/fibronectin type III domain protein